MGSRNTRAARIDEEEEIPGALARQAIARGNKPGASLNYGSIQASSISPHIGRTKRAAERMGRAQRGDASGPVRQAMTSMGIGEED